MQQGHGYLKDSKWFCKTRNLLLLSLLLILIALGCIVHIDNVCSLGLEELPNLPEEASATPAITEPSVPEYPIYDIPLSPDLQRFTYERCLEYDVDPIMVYAIMWVESDFRSDVVSDTGDYGLMQINVRNLLP